MHHAEHEFALSAPVLGDPFGSSIRETLAKGASNGDPNAIARLAGPPLPETLVYLWRWYLELRAVQHSGLNGPEPINHTQLLAWQQNTGRSLAPWEVDAIIALDTSARRAMTPSRSGTMVAPPTAERVKRRRDRG